MNNLEEKEFIMQINDYKYYSKHPAVIISKRCHEKWRKIATWFMSIGVITFFATLIAGCYGECNKSFPVVAIILTSVFGFIAIFGMTIGGICFKASDHFWESYDYGFRHSDEFEVQNQQRLNLEKKVEDMRKHNKATKLVEAYDILDDANLPKEERIELIKKYIDKE